MSTFTDEVTQLLTEKGLFLAVTVSTALLSEDRGGGGYTLLQHVQLVPLCFPAHRLFPKPYLPHRKAYGSANCFIVVTTMLPNL